MVHMNLGKAPQTHIAPPIAVNSRNKHLYYVCINTVQNSYTIHLLAQGYVRNNKIKCKVHRSEKFVIYNMH